MYIRIHKTVLDQVFIRTDNKKERTKSATVSFFQNIYCMIVINKYLRGLENNIRIELS